MLNSEIIRLHIPSPAHMGMQGNAFGMHFLQPLVESDDAHTNQIAVALYGCQGSGKTVFSAHTGRSFSEFQVIPAYNPFDEAAAIVQIHNDKEIRNGWILNAANLLGQDRIFRFQDCGSRRFLHTGGNLPRTYMPRLDSDSDPTDPLTLARKYYGEFASPHFTFGAPGFDIVEHATKPHLDAAHVVIIIANSDFRNIDYFDRYFRKEQDYSSDPFDRYDDVAVADRWSESSNPKIDDVIAEVAYLKSLSIRPDERYASIILTSDNPVMRETFKKFALRAYQL